MTNAQRQQRARAKKAAQGLREVREIWAPPDKHEAVRIYARQFLVRNSKKP